MTAIRLSDFGRERIAIAWFDDWVLSGIPGEMVVRFDCPRQNGYPGVIRGTASFNLHEVDTDVSRAVKPSTLRIGDVEYHMRIVEMDEPDRYKCASVSVQLFVRGDEADWKKPL